MLRSIDKLRGFTVKCTDGDVGKVHDLYFDSETWHVRYAVVNTGPWLLGRLVLISPLALQPPFGEEEVLPVALTKKQVEESPTIDIARPVSQQQLIGLHDYYGWAGYWMGNSAWMASPVAMYPPALQDITEDDENYLGDPYLRSTREVDGYHIQATDGEIGHVEDFFVDEKSWIIRYLLVDTRNWLPGRDVLISPDWVEEINWLEGKVHVRVTQKLVKNSPEYNPAQPPERKYEMELYKYYGFPGYWGV